MSYYYSNNNQQHNSRENPNVVYVIPQEHPNYNEHNYSEEKNNKKPNHKKGKKLKEYNEIEFLFSEKSIRRAFARKVFLILSLLLLKTTAICAICMYYEPVKNFWNEEGNKIYVLAPIPVYIIAIIFVICIPGATRTPPWNYINLLLISTSLSIMIGAICSWFETPDMVLIAFGITVVLVFGLTIFSIQTHIDFTGWRMFAFVLVLNLILMCILCFTFWSRAVNISIASVGIFIFSLYLIIDIQLIINGKRRYSISPEDYILAVILIYMDIVQIFLYILSLLRYAK